MSVIVDVVAFVYIWTMAASALSRSTSPPRIRDAVALRAFFRLVELWA